MSTCEAGFRIASAGSSRAVSSHPWSKAEKWSSPKLSQLLCSSVEAIDRKLRTGSEFEESFRAATCVLAPRQCRNVTKRIVTSNPTLRSRLSPDRDAPFQHSCTPSEAGAERSKQDSSAIARRADAKQVSQCQQH